MGRRWITKHALNTILDKTSAEKKDLRVHVDNPKVCLYISGSGSITSVGEECCCLLVIMWFLFGEVPSSSVCLGWATLFYCGTP